MEGSATLSDSGDWQHELIYLDSLPNSLCKLLPKAMTDAMDPARPLSPWDIYHIVAYWVVAQSEASLSETAADFADVFEDDEDDTSMKPCDSEGDDALTTVPPPPLPSPRKRHRTEDPELLVPTSPRIFGKQSIERVVTMKPSTRYCQGEQCVFSRGKPGQPAHVDGKTYCHWCDAEAMSELLKTGQGRRLISSAMSDFRDYPQVLEAAAARLPDDWEGAARYCQAPGCVFNSSRPGHPARCGGSNYETFDPSRSSHGKLCMWCSPAVLKSMASTPGGVKKINKQLTLFKDDDPEIYALARALVPDGVVSRYDPHGNKLCTEEDCTFSMKRPGQPARVCRGGGSFCLWHDEEILDGKLQTWQGRRDIRRVLARIRRSNIVQDGFPLWRLVSAHLPRDFALSARFCCDVGCCFSMQEVGEPARANPGNGLCTWCDPVALAAREKSPQGPGSIAHALCHWASEPLILLAAWRKLSADTQTQAAEFATPHWENKRMAEQDFMEHPMWLNSAFELEQMEKHDLLMHPDRCGLTDSPFTRRCGLECDICGLTYLYTGVRRHHHVRYSGRCDDPMQIQRIFRSRNEMPSRRHWHPRPDFLPEDMDMRCTLCWEAKCRQCSSSLLLSDFIWRQECVHCGCALTVDFVRRPKQRPTWIFDENGLGHWPIDRLEDTGVSTAHLAYQHSVNELCCCCGRRVYSGFFYLSWLSDKTDVFSVPFWTTDVMFKQTRDCGRADIRCQDCRSGFGTRPGLEKNLCPWSRSEFAYHFLGRSYYWECACRRETL